MKRLVWLMTAFFFHLVPASAEVVPHYFTWFNTSNVEKGPVLAGEDVLFQVPVVDGVAQLPAGYFVTNYSWFTTAAESDPGTCDVPIEAQSGTSLPMSFATAGSYELCLEMFPEAGGESLWDKQVLNVGAEPNVAPSVQYVDVVPNPAVVNWPLQFVSAQIYDEDGVDSCEVDFDDGNGYVLGTITPSEWDSSTFTCTGPAYAFEASGFYDVTVRATDMLGLSGTSNPTIVEVFARPYIVVDKVWVESTLARSRRLYDYTGTVDLVGIGSAASLAKAQVSAEWRDLNTGAVLFRQTATANADGRAKFVMRSVANYPYLLCVTNVKKSGWAYYVAPAEPVSPQGPIGGRACGYGGGPN